jgi:hypothetical protein
MQKYEHETGQRRMDIIGFLGIAIFLVIIVSMMFFVVTFATNHQMDTADQENHVDCMQEAADKDRDIQNGYGINENQKIQEVVRYSNATKSSTIFENTTITYGEGAVNVYLGYGTTGDTSGYDLAVGTVQDVFRACLTEEELRMVEDGSTINIDISISDISSVIDDETYTSIENALPDFYGSTQDLSMGLVVDIAMVKQVNDGDWKSVCKLEAPLKITFYIPQILQNSGREYYMVRSHGGVCTLLEDVGNDKERMTFETSLFSTFALVYHQVAFINRFFDNAIWFGHIICVINTVLWSGVMMLYARDKDDILSLSGICVVINLICALVGNSNLDYLIASVSSFTMVGLAFFQMEKFYISNMKNDKDKKEY